MFHSIHFPCNNRSFPFGLFNSLSPLTSQHWPLIHSMSDSCFSFPLPRRLLVFSPRPSHLSPSDTRLHLCLFSCAFCFLCRMKLPAHRRSFRILLKADTLMTRRPGGFRIFFCTVSVCSTHQIFIYAWIYMCTNTPFSAIYGYIVAFRAANDSLVRIFPGILEQRSSPVCAWEAHICTSVCIRIRVHHRPFVHAWAYLYICMSVCVYFCTCVEQAFYVAIYLDHFLAVSVHLLPKSL